MPNFSMIEKVVQQVWAIDYLVSKYTFLLINQFVQIQKFLIDEDISRMGLLGSSKECTHGPLNFVKKFGMTLQGNSKKYE